ncbi:MAG: twin-arginine translocation signal domain-containing protein, partial [Terriglobia bacterium]
MSADKHNRREFLGKASMGIAAAGLSGHL